MLPNIFSFNDENILSKKIVCEQSKRERCYIKIVFIFSCFSIFFVTITII